MPARLDGAGAGPEGAPATAMEDPIPLLCDWDAPFGMPPLGAFADADFAPAFDAALAEARANVDAVAADPAPPTFANIIKAMERAELLAGLGLEGPGLDRMIWAETIAYGDFVGLGGEQGAKEAGKMRSEGKAYRVADGDVLHFLFNA